MFPRLHILAVGLLAAWVATPAPPALPQSLGDIARQEEARRKQIKRPGKVYTNKDLGSVPAAPLPPVGATPPGPAAESARASGASEPAASAETRSSDKSAARGQAYWAGRMKDLAAQLERDQTLAAAMQTRINALTADFTARDDPAQREVIGRDRQRALDELDRLQKAVQSDQKAIADFEEEARRAAVPPGWLR
jgi:hypothetical protein